MSPGVTVPCRSRRRSWAPDQLFPHQLPPAPDLSVVWCDTTGSDGDRNRIPKKAKSTVDCIDISLHCSLFELKFFRTKNVETIEISTMINCNKLTFPCQNILGCLIYNNFVTGQVKDQRKCDHLHRSGLFTTEGWTRGCMYLISVVFSGPWDNFKMWWYWILIINLIAELSVAIVYVRLSQRW